MNSTALCAANLAWNDPVTATRETIKRARDAIVLCPPLPHPCAREFCCTRIRVTIWRT